MNMRLLLLKLGLIAGLLFFCRAFFPHPLWIPFWLYMTALVILKIKGGPNTAAKRPRPGEKPSSPKQDAPDKPHWGKYK